MRDFPGFLLLKTCIKKSLIELDLGELWIESNILILNNLLNVLKPIKIAVEALCRRNMNLLKADVIANTLCHQISSIRTSLGQQMFEALKNRIEERRDKRLYTLIKFLSNPDIFNNVDEVNLFSYASKSTIICYAECLYNRLFGDPNIDEEIKSSDDECDIVEKTFEEVLNNAINSVNNTVNAKFKQCSTYSIKKDLKFFEGCGKKTENIQNLFDALLTIRPTSVESERNFSLSGLFVNKIRNRLSDESINAFSVLKTYFQNQD